MEINRRFFPTKRSALRYVSNFLQNTRRLEPEDAAWVIRDVLSLHPQWATKSKGMQSIAIRPQGRPGNNMFVIRKHDGATEDISYRTCITTRSERSQVNRALRQAVNPDISAFRSKMFPASDSEVACAACATPCRNTPSTHVDHVVPFRTIVANFATQHGIDLTAIQTRSSGTYRLISDVDLRTAWHSYHTAHAALRVMCAKCNLQKG